MPPTTFSETLRREANATTRQFEDEQVGRGTLSYIHPSDSSSEIGDQCVRVEFNEAHEAHSYYDKVEVFTIEGEPISHPGLAIGNDQLAAKIVEAGVRLAKSHAQMQEGIFGDGKGHERDPYWPRIEI